MDAIARARADRERREREAAERAAREKAERRERRRRKEAAAAEALAMAQAQAQAQAQAHAAALAASSNGVGSGRSNGSVRRPPEVGGFGGGLGAVPPGMEAVMPGPPPPPGVRFGANKYTGFGNPALEGVSAGAPSGGLRGYGEGGLGGGFAGIGGTHDWKSQVDSFMSTTKSQTEGMMSQAKGWLSGALKSMADKLDGNSAGGVPAAQKPQTGFHAYHAETPEEAARRRWDAAQTNLFAAGGGRAGPGGERAGKTAAGSAEGFYDDVDSDDASSDGNRTDGDSDEFPMAKRSNAGARGGAFVPGMAGHAQGRASDRADVFANSIKGLASDFGGQANISSFYSDDEDE